MQNRRKNLLRNCREIDCDVLVAFEPENLFYLTGFWGEAIGILEAGKTTIIAPKLEAERAKAESVDCTVVGSEHGADLVSDLVARIKNKQACTDCQNYTTMQLLKKSVPKLRHSTGPFYDARIIKDSQEISILKKASKIIDDMYELCTKKIRKGQSESELQ